MSVRRRFIEQFELNYTYKCVCWWCGKQGELLDDVAIYDKANPFNKKGFNMFEIDHYLPVSLGGSNELDNLVLSCRKCNRTKHNKYWTFKGKPDYSKEEMYG